MNAEIVIAVITTIGAVLGALFRLQQMRTQFDAENARRDDQWRDLLTQKDAQWSEYSRKRLELTEAEFKRITKINEQLTVDVATALEKYAEADTRASERAGRIEELLVKLEQARKDLMGATREAATREGEVTQLKRQVDDLQLALNRLQREMTSLMEQNRTLRETRQSLEAENKRLTHELTESKSQEQQLLNRITELEQRLAEVESENRSLKARVDEINRRWEESQRENKLNGTGVLYDTPALPGGGESIGSSADDGHGSASERAQ